MYNLINKLSLFIFILSLQLSCAKDDIVNNPPIKTIPDLNLSNSKPNNPPILPKDYVQLIGKGFDVTWSEFNKYRDRYSVQAVIDFKKAGFDHVRIRLGEDDLYKSPDIISSLVQQVEDCISHGVYPIISYQGHNIEESKDGIESDRQKLTSWWGEIARIFKNHSNMLSFNILIEISGTYKTDYTSVNSFYKSVLDTIRKTNSQRIVIFPPVAISNPGYLKYLEIPYKGIDKYTMAEWHLYAAGPKRKKKTKKYWDNGKTLEERKRVTDLIDTAVSWMNATGYKTWVGAWMAGNYNKGGGYTTSQQVAFGSFMTRELAKVNIPWAINAGNKYYDYETNKWFSSDGDTIASAAVKDALINPYKVTVYKDTIYAGESYNFSPGEYNSIDLEAKNFLGQVKSIMVPFDFEVELYNQPDFKCSKILLDSTSGNLKNFVVRSMRIRYLDSY